MSRLRLQRTLPRQHWASAVWEVQEWPGLILYRPDSGPRVGSWMFGVMGVRDAAQPRLERTAELLRRSGLQEQCFPERRQALQALGAVLALEGACR